jgi:hypothetical protein
MGSVFHSAMKQTSGAFTELLGERDAHGDFEKIIANPPGRQPVEISGTILGNEEVQQIEDENNNLVKKQVRYLTFPIQVGLTEIEVKTTFEIGGKKWAVQQVGSRKDGTWLTYQLERKPLQQLDPKRDARTV